MKFPPLPPPPPAVETKFFSSPSLPSFRLFQSRDVNRGRMEKRGRKEKAVGERIKKLFSPKEKRKGGDIYHARGS